MTDRLIELEERSSESCLLVLSINQMVRELMQPLFASKAGTRAAMAWYGMAYELLPNDAAQLVEMSPGVSPDELLQAGLLKRYPSDGGLYIPKELACCFWVPRQQQRVA